MNFQNKNIEINMFWSFIAIFFSAWLYIDAYNRNLMWQCWLFKPITLILIFILAWQYASSDILDNLILSGLCTSLIGDILILISNKKLVNAFGAFFLSYLFYTIYFTSYIKFSFFWPLPLILILIGVITYLSLWNKLEDMKWPICTFISMALVMVWLSGELWLLCSTISNLSSFIGTWFLLTSNIIWLFKKYNFVFYKNKFIHPVLYFLGHFLIAYSLQLKY